MRRAAGWTSGVLTAVAFGFVLASIWGFYPLDSATTALVLAGAALALGSYSVEGESAETPAPTCGCRP